MSAPNPRTPELASILREALSVLAQASPFCVLRNFEELPDYTAHDVDVLVPGGNLVAAAEAVRAAGARAGWLLAAEVRQDCVHSLYFYLSAGGALQTVTFDLVTDLPWGWFATCDVEHVRRTAVRRGGITVPAPGAEAALRLIKELVRGRPLKPAARDAVRDGIAADETGFRLTFRGLLGDGTVARLAALVAAGDFDGLPRLASRIRRDLVIRACRRPLRQAARVVSYSLGRLRRFRTGALGALVVMAGPDGTGKTTLCRRLADGVGESFFKGAVVFHSQFGFLPRLRKLARSATGLNMDEPDFTLRHSGSSVRPHPPLRTFLYLLYYSWDYLLGRLAVRRLRGHSRLILFDRYFHDRYYQPAYLRTSRRLLDFFRAVVPRPDVVLLLTADVEAVYRRKPELTPGEIRRQLDAAAELARRLGPGTSVVTVRSDVGEEAAEHAAAAGILDAIRKRNYGDK